MPAVQHAEVRNLRLQSVIPKSWRVTDVSPHVSDHYSNQTIANYSACPCGRNKGVHCNPGTKTHRFVRLGNSQYCLPEESPGICPIHNAPSMMAKNPYVIQHGRGIDTAPLSAPAIEKDVCKPPDPNHYADQAHRTGFIKFLVRALSTHNEKEYSWRYAIKEPVPWLHSDFLSGNSLEQATTVLDVAGVILRSALEDFNSQRCFEAVRTIMAWGGVYYPVGSRAHNEATVTHLRDSGQLVYLMMREMLSLRARRAEDVSLMNSGWTKVWAALLPNEFIMYDSRVARAISLYLRNYCDANGLSAPASEIDFCQTVPDQDTRYVKGVRICRSPQDRAKTNLQVSQLLADALRYAQIEQIDIVRYTGLGVRGIEARLFMIGQ